MRRVISPIVAHTFGSLFSLLTFVGLLGNLLVMVAILGDRKMRKSVMNLLLLNLAIADALNLLATTVEWVPTMLMGAPVWVLPAALCPVIRYLECVFLFTSILTQLVVCVERYIAIILPLHARRLCSRKNILLTIVAVWSIVALGAVPYALHNEKRKNSSACVNVHANTDFWFNYKLAEFTLLYLLPCVIFLTLYTKICTVLWAKNRQLYEVSLSATTAETGTCLPPQRGSNQLLSTPPTEAQSTACSRANSAAGFVPVVGAREEALKTRRSVVKMLVACVSVYFICYSPIQAIFLCRGLFNIPIHPPYEFILLMNALAILCSACNPLLYTLFSRRFRTRIAGLLCCWGHLLDSLRGAKKEMGTSGRGAGGGGGRQTVLRMSTRNGNGVTFSSTNMDE